MLYRHYALREGSGGAGKQRGGFGLAYEVEILRGEARASFVMDHGRFGPQGALGGSDGAVNTVTVFRGGEAHVPPHLSKEQDIPLKAGDRVRVGTPGGGGYGDPLERDPALVLHDVAMGYYTRGPGSEKFGVVIGKAERACDLAATATSRRRAKPSCEGGPTLRQLRLKRACQQLQEGRGLARRQRRQRLLGDFSASGIRRSIASRPPPSG